jgi:archaellum component FlaC
MKIYLLLLSIQSSIFKGYKNQRRMVVIMNIIFRKKKPSKIERIMDLLETINDDIQRIIQECKEVTA